MRTSKTISVIFLMALGLAIIAFLPTSAHSFTIESDASIYEDITNRQLKALVGLIEAYGYRCDSVSAARPFLLSFGFTVYCNGYRYEYHIEDRGGTWTVTID